MGRRWIAVVAVSGCVALGACGSSAGVETVGAHAATTSPPATAPSSSTPATDEVATTEPADTEPVDTEPADTEPVDTEPPETAPPNDGEALPVGDPKVSVFSLASEAFGTTWEGYIGGLVATGLDQYNDEQGRCVVLVGTITPTKLGEGAVASGYSAPTMSLIVDGELVDQGYSECDVAAIEQAGYGRSLDASLTPGTTFAFYSPFFIEGDGTAKIDSVLIGDASSKNTVTFEPTIVDQLPAPGTGSIGPLDVTLLPIGDATASAFTASAAYEDYSWSGVMQGVVESEHSDYSDTPGRCVTVFGTITPSGAGEGTIAGGGDTPALGVIAGGRLYESNGYDCDDTAIRAAGYRPLYDAAVTPGTSFPFFQQYLIAGDPATVGTDKPLEAVVVGDATLDGATYFEPSVQAAIAAPLPATVGKLEATIVPTGDASKFTYRDQYGTTTWTGVVDGLVDTGLSTYTDLTGARCVVLLGTFTPTVIDEGTTTSSYDIPAMGIISGGHLVDSTSFDCDTAAAEAAGYQPAYDAELTVGTSYRFSAAIAIADPAASIDAIVIGNARVAGATYFAPTVLPAIPTHG